jgi:hypothetical protein
MSDNSSNPLEVVHRGRTRAGSSAKIPQFTRQAGEAKPTVFIFKVPGLGHSMNGWNPNLDVKGSIIEAFSSFRPSPLMNVREDWPTYQEICLRPRPVAGETYTVPEFHRQFPDLTLTGRFGEGETTVAGLRWRDRIWELRSCLLRLCAGQMARNFELAALLQTVGDGLEHAVYMMTSFISLRGTTTWRNDNHDSRFPAAADMVDADLPGVDETKRIRGRIYTRRFIATLFHFKTAMHWVGAVFDRATGHLILYDTLGKGRRERARLAAAAWRQFGANLGFTGSITAISAPQVDQPNSWACGFLAIASIHATVRAASGWALHHLIQDCGSITDRHYLDGADQTQVGMDRPLSMPVADYSFGAERRDLALGRASALLKAIICNELGIPSSTILEARLGKPHVGTEPHWIFKRDYPGCLVHCTIQDAENWLLPPFQPLGPWPDADCPRFYENLPPKIDSPPPLPGFPLGMGTLNDRDKDQFLTKETTQVRRPAGGNPSDRPGALPAHAEIIDLDPPEAYIILSDSDEGTSII